MKIFILLLFMVMGITACAPATIQLTRQDLIQRLAPMRELESRYEELETFASFAMSLGISAEDYEVEAVKDHLNLYWLHINAANVAIANKEVERYEKHLQLSEVEINAVESMIKRLLHGLKSDRLRMELSPRLNF